MTEYKQLKKMLSYNDICLFYKIFQPLINSNNIVLKQISDR